MYSENTLDRLNNKTSAAQLLFGCGTFDFFLPALVWVETMHVAQRKRPNKPVKTSSFKAKTGVKSLLS